MGIAEIIPGVSGGTIAFITGIYPELLRTLAALNPTTVRTLFRDGPAAFWHRQNLTFLIVLLAGMATSILLLANVMQYLITTVPTMVWAFFFGLILAASIHIAAQNTRFHLATLGLAGFVVAVGLGLLGSGTVTPGYGLLFVGSAIAVTAWLLPGISGSYMLLLMGLYPAFVAAIAEFQFDRIVVIALGLVTGLLLFAQLLAHLLRHHYFPVMALLTGFMAGSLVMLWPWRIAVDAVNGRALYAPVDPWSFAAATGQEPLVAGAVATAVAGIVVIVMLTRLGRQPAVEHG
jgi:putative membrane protein